MQGRALVVDGGHTEVARGGACGVDHLRAGTVRLGVVTLEGVLGRERGGGSASTRGLEGDVVGANGLRERLGRKRMLARGVCEEARVELLEDHRRAELGRVGVVEGDLIQPRIVFLLSYHEQYQLFLFTADYLCQALRIPGGMFGIQSDMIHQFIVDNNTVDSRIIDINCPAVDDI